MTKILVIGRQNATGKARRGISFTIKAREEEGCKHWDTANTTTEGNARSLVPGTKIAEIKL